MTRRKPSRLKLVEGTARADRMNGKEPEPPAGDVTRPEFVKYRAAELWDQYAPALVAMGTLTIVDVPNFAAWCVMTARFEECGGIMKSSDVAQMRLFASSLGMDASSRAKIGAGGKAKNDDPANEFFKTG
jgi:phage terminase small subunit